MKWLKYRLETTTEATDLIIDMLAELGIYGVEVIDKVPLTEAEKKQMYVDILPESEPNDGSAELVTVLLMSLHPHSTTVEQELKI